MHIIVCIKQVPDPEGPRESFVINEQLNVVEPQGIPPVMSLFDENALEAALRLKDKDKENVKVTILSIGKRVSDAVMIKALAAGADELIKVEDPVFDSAALDSVMAAQVLAAAIKKIDDYSLILVGRQAADWNAGQVGTNLAGLLNLPCITMAQKVETEGNSVIVERVTSGGYTVVQTDLPAVVMVSNEVGELRYPAMKLRRDAKNKPKTAWKMDDISLESLNEKKLVLKRLFTPVMEAGQCEMIDGDSPEKAADQLVKALKEVGVI